MSNQMICGDALLVLRTLPSNHVHMICTSPPYYGLRDYGVDGQIGLEESPAEAIKEPTSDMTRMLSASNRTAHSRQGNGEEGKSVRFGSTPNGRNKRSVWSIPTTPFKESHFAVMAPELARICILAGSAEKTCEHCGAAWERITETEYMQGKTSGKGNRAVLEDVSSTSVFLTGLEPRTRTVGFQPTCACPGNTGSGKSIVLDPFCGAGTTAFVAAKSGRAYLGIELNPAYVEMSRRRLVGLADGFWGFAEEIA